MPRNRSSRRRLGPGTRRLGPGTLGRICARRCVRPGATARGAGNPFGMKPCSASGRPILSRTTWRTSLSGPKFAMRSTKPPVSCQMVWPARPCAVTRCSRHTAGPGGFRRSGASARAAGPRQIAPDGRIASANQAPSRGRRRPLTRRHPSGPERLARGRTDSQPQPGCRTAGRTGRAEWALLTRPVRDPRPPGGGARHAHLRSLLSSSGEMVPSRSVGVIRPTPPGG